MVSGLVVALTMIGICVVAPTAITLTTTTIVKKSKAKGNALKAETALRKAAKSSEKNPSKEKKLVKRYYKTKLAAASKVLPNYDNMSKENFFLKKLGKNEIARQKLIAKVGLAEVKGSQEEANRLRSTMQAKYPKPEFATKYNYVQSVNLAGVNIELPSNSIHCDSKTLAEEFKERIINTPERDERDYPFVMELSSGENKIASMSTVSKTRFDNFVPNLMAEAYVKALVDEANGEQPDYSVTTFDSQDPTQAHEHKYTSSQSISDCVFKDLGLNLATFYEKAKKVAKEIVPDVELTIDGEKINAKPEPQKVNTQQKKVQKSPASTKVTEDISKEDIICKSAKTQKKFESTFGKTAFMPDQVRKGFQTNIECNGQKISSLNTESYTRGTTFTINLLAEAYRTALAHRRDGVDFEIDFASSYKTTENGKVKQVMKANTFKTPEDILNFVTSTYSCSEDKFKELVGELDAELGVYPAIPKPQEEKPKMIECMYKSAKTAYNEATKYYAKDPAGANLSFVHITNEEITDPNLNKTVAMYTADKEQVLNNTNFMILSEIFRKHFLNVEQTKRNSVKINYNVQLGELEKIGHKFTEKENFKITNLQDLVKYLNKIGYTFDQMSTKAKALDQGNQMSI